MTLHKAPTGQVFAQSGCDVDYVVVNQWNTGFQANVTITNNSSTAVSGWTLTWTFDGGEQFIWGWNATFSASGSSMSASNMAGHWNGTIGANGGTVSFGFLGTHNGDVQIPDDFAVNGTACNGAPPNPTATSQPPTATNVPPTATSIPPTATNMPPTATNVPPTATNVPPTATSQPGGVIPQSGWALHYADSQELVGENGAATNAFDGNASTIWHTEWLNASPSHPHEIQINLGDVYSVNGFRYLPRQTSTLNGTIAQYQFYVSIDGSNWGGAVATGTFASNGVEKEVTFAAQTGQFVRLVALSEVNGNPWTSAAEINVLGSSTGGPTVTPTPIPPTQPPPAGMRQMEALNRGVVRVVTGSGNLVSWRLFGTDPAGIGFNVYRGANRLNGSPITSSTNYLDSGGSASSTYTVRPVINGQEQAASEPSLNISGSYLSVPLQRPPGGSVNGSSYEYIANDGSVGDLDGDGDYEIVLKWYPSNAKDNSQAGYTGNTILDAYELDGTRLWRINMGINIRSGAHYTQFLVYDFDGDGDAEVVAKTADGTVDGQGTVIGSASADYRNSDGYVLAGPEYLTVFDGRTGAALDTENYLPPRGNVCDWGDCYGNRVDRFLATVAYLDGARPSIVMTRGYYTRSVLVAWNFRNGQLSHVWTFDTDNGYGAYAGQGNHNLSAGDVDDDGFDEIIFGAMAVDHDGSGLWNSGLGHGDAMHFTDLIPGRPGLEVWGIHENASMGSAVLDAQTGAVVWGTGPADVARGVAADITASSSGAECWGGTNGLRRCSDGAFVGSYPASENHLIWWDSDPVRELLDGISITKYGGGTLLSASGAASNNGTKSNPVLTADFFGDWREEVIWRASDNNSLRIYVTPYQTNIRIYTLMHDPIYRLGIAWQNVAYNQPPHTGFFLGDGMAPPPVPDIYFP